MDGGPSHHPLSSPPAHTFVCALQGDATVTVKRAVAVADTTKRRRRHELTIDSGPDPRQTDPRLGQGEARLTGMRLVPREEDALRPVSLFRRRPSLAMCRC
jgi:hypothetical protein